MTGAIGLLNQSQNLITNIPYTGNGTFRVNIHLDRSLALHLISFQAKQTFFASFTLVPRLVYLGRPRLLSQGKGKFS